MTRSSIHWSILIPGLALFTVLGATGTVAVVDDGLVAHWKLDEGVGETIADESGKHEGMIIGPSWTKGKFGNGLAFVGGREERIVIPYHSLLNPTEEFTISLWIKPDEFHEGENRVFFLPDGYNLDLVNGAGRVEAHVNGRYEGAYGQDAVTTGRWHHFAGTYSRKRGELKFYVDGVSQGANLTVSGPATVNQSNVVVGATGWAEAAKGIYDDIRVYRRALSPGEIQVLAKQ